MSQPASDNVAGPTPDVGTVPQFTPAPDLVAHHGLLQRIGQGVQGFAQRAGTSIAGLDPAVAQNLSPEQAVAARKAALFHLGTSMLSNTTDKFGRGTTALERLGAGLEAGREGGQQSAAGSIQANQYNTGLQQSQRVLQARQAVAQAWNSVPGDDDVSKTQRLDRLTRGVITLASVGDDKGAQALDGAIKGLRENQALAAGNRKQLKDLGDRFAFYDPVTNALTELDGSPVKDATKQISKAQAAAGERQVRGQDITQTDHNDSADQGVARAYQTSTADLRKENVAYNSFKSIAGMSAKGYPEAYKSTIINYMGALDPKAQVRSKMLEFASKIDPSIAGSFETFKQRVMSGAFPVDQLDGMKAIADASHATYQRLLQTQYDETIKRRPSAKRYLPDPNSVMLNAADVTPGGVSYSPNNPYAPK